MTSDCLFARDAELIETEIDGDMVALDVARGVCFGLNATASRVWALVAQPASLATIVARLGEEFDVPPDDCEREVAELLDMLTREGLVRRIEREYGGV